jgi:hypothetical protein
MILKLIFCWEWGHTPVAAAPGELKKEDCEFEATIVYIA